MQSEDSVDLALPLTTGAMDPDTLRKQGKEMVDFVADYWQSLRDGTRQPKPDVAPGSIKALFPAEAPQQPESWEAIRNDIEGMVLAGNTHWHHPNFHAYYPTGCSYPSLMADILTAGISCVGFTWNSSPSCTEVEMAMMDWLVKALGLPEHFLFSHEGDGGGILQVSASDSTLVALLGAKARALRRYEKREESIPVIENEEEQNGVWKLSKTVMSFVDDRFRQMRSVIDTFTRGAVQSKLVTYCSAEAHSSVERACMLATVNVHKVKTDVNYAMRGDALETAIREDKAKGLIPFFVVATLGTTNSCAFDALPEIATVCAEHELWLHVDAAYAGSAFICPEYRYLMEGVDKIDTFNFNPHKWMLINFDCSAMWFRDIHSVEGAFHVDPTYLQHKGNQGTGIPDYRHMQVPLGRRFRSLKLWFVLRSFGINAIQEHIRWHCLLAREFEFLVLSDDRFEIVVPVIMGLVCFRVKGESDETERLHTAINEDGRIHLVGAHLASRFILRFAICSALTNPEDIRRAWTVISECTDKIL